MSIVPSSDLFPNSVGAQQKNVPLLRSGTLGQTQAINISPLRGETLKKCLWKPEVFGRSLAAFSFSEK